MSLYSFKRFIVILFSNAKINIGLNITGKREDGFHDLESIFYPIPWCDIIEILPATEDLFSYSGIQIDPENNLVKDAVNLLRSKFNIPSVRVHLHKNIPAGAGLGGGSSNGSCTLIGLNHLFDLQLTNKELKGLSLNLGSDCPFFIDNIPSFVQGRGEVINPSPLDLSGKYILLINNGTHISTKEAFWNLKPEKKNFPTDLSEMSNDFEKTIFPGHPGLAQIKKDMLESGAHYASLTGTGSTIYGLFDEKPKKPGRYEFEKIFQL